jgi:hypothetical protein
VEPRDLRCFIAIAEERSFTDAAARGGTAVTSAECLFSARADPDNAPRTAGDGLTARSKRPK